MIDPRAYEVEIALSDGAVLTAEQTRLVMEEIESVRHQAVKWRLMMQRPGRVVIIDPETVDAIREVLRDDQEQRGEHAS